MTTPDPGAPQDSELRVTAIVERPDPHAGARWLAALRLLLEAGEGVDCTRFVSGEGRHQVQASCPLAPAVPCSPEAPE